MEDLKMVGPLLLAVTLALCNELVLGSTIVSAQTGGTEGAATGGDSKRVESKRAGAVITGKPGEAIDSSTLTEFDQCRAAIDVTNSSIKGIEEAVKSCQAVARKKSAPLANPNFEDIKKQQRPAP